MKKKNPNSPFGFYHLSWFNETFEPQVIYFSTDGKIYESDRKFSKFKLKYDTSLQAILHLESIGAYRLFPISSRISINFLKEKIKHLDPKGYKLLG